MPPWLRVDVLGEVHAPGHEDPWVHDAQVGGDAWPEAHVRENVALDVEAWRDLDQLEPLRTDANRPDMNM